MRVVNEGAIVVNHCSPYPSSGIVALCIDLEQKYSEIVATGSTGEIPCIVIGANEHTIGFGKGADRSKTTEIEFPEFSGWFVFCAEISKYTLSVCLVKREDEVDLWNSYGTPKKPPKLWGTAMTISAE